MGRTYLVHRPRWACALQRLAERFIQWLKRWDRYERLS